LAALVRYVAWDVEMSTPNEEGATLRDALRELARRGRTDVLEKLNGPRLPRTVRYLLDWTRDIRRGVGRDTNGLAPLTWVSLDAWARHTDHQPAPHEVDAIFLLDAVMRDPSIAEAYA
jgi:hypothetical protein